MMHVDHQRGDDWRNHHPELAHAIVENDWLGKLDGEPTRLNVWYTRHERLFVAVAVLREVDQLDSPSLALICQEQANEQMDEREGRVGSAVCPVSKCDRSSCRQP
jgi:hypothetical protein